MRQDYGLTYSSKCARKSDQSDDSHGPHVDSVTPCAQRECFGLGSELFHEHAVSLCCFGDPLGSYCGAVAKVVVSLRCETVYVDSNQLLSFNVSLE